MVNIKKLRDDYGVIHEANKNLPDDKLRLKFLAAVAELEDDDAHTHQEYPKTRLHKVAGLKFSVYRADVDKISGWRIHVQFYKDDKSLHLKQLVPGSKHDNVHEVIKTKKDRYAI